MKAFVITVLVMFVLDVIAKAVILRDRKTERDLDAIPFEIAANMAILMWGCWALAGGAK